MNTRDIFLSNASLMDEYVKGFEMPYQAIPGIGEMINQMGPSFGFDFINHGDGVWIHETAKVDKDVVLVGPCIIDAGAEIKHNATLDGNVFIGKNVVIGNACEVRNAIVYDNSVIPHYNLVEDAIIGTNVHLGAGVTITSEKISNTDVVIKDYVANTGYLTKMKNVGSFIGDNVVIGCNSVLNPGTIVMPNTSIYPLCLVRGIIPGDSVYKSKDVIIKKISSI